MNDFSLINATVDWCCGPRLDIKDNSYSVYAINFNQKIRNDWCSIHEQNYFKPFFFFKSNFRFRIKWQIKAWAYSNDLIQVMQKTYDETNKNICLNFNNDSYESHKLWYNKSIKLSKENNFNLFIISKFEDRLRKDIVDPQCRIIKSIDDFEFFKSKNNIYAYYNIGRNEMLTFTEDWWHSGKIFVNHSRLISSWDHPQDWLGMNDEEIYNNIMDI